MDVIVRSVTPDDARGVVGVLNPIIQAGCYTVLDKPFTVEEEQEFICDFHTRGIFNVAESITEKRIVGFQSLEPFADYTSVFDHVAVIGTYVDLTRLGRGIGKLLAVATFQTAVTKGYEKIFTYVRGDNLGAQRFYLGLGFRIVGTARKQAKLATGYVDEIVIEKQLVC